MRKVKILVIALMVMITTASTCSYDCEGEWVTWHERTEDGEMAQYVCVPVL